MKRVLTLMAFVVLFTIMTITIADSPPQAINALNNKKAIVDKKIINSNNQASLVVPLQAFSPQLALLGSPAKTNIAGSMHANMENAPTKMLNTNTEVAVTALARSAPQQLTGVASQFHTAGSSGIQLQT